MPSCVLTCGSLGQVQTVGVVNFGAAGLLAGDDLPAVSAVETFVLALLHHLQLALPLRGHLLLSFTGLVLRRGLVLKQRGTCTCVTVMRSVFPCL